MEHFAYLIFTLATSGIFILVLMKVFWKKIKKHLFFLFLANCIAILFAAVGDSIGSEWGAWTYNTQKSLGSIFPSATFETVLTGIAMATVYGILILVFADREEKKKPFWPIK